jgi:sugar phosphate permease
MLSPLNLENSNKRISRTSVLVICFLLYIISFRERLLLSAVLETMKIDLGFTDTQAGMLQTTFFLSMVGFVLEAE